MVDPRTDSRLAMARRDRARQMRREGMAVREIARALGRSVHTVRGYVWEGGNGRAQEYTQWPLMSVAEKAEEMASVYPDPVRQAWILRQFGVER